MINNRFFYDETNDILSINKDFKNGEKFKTNIDIGSVVLDLSTQGRIVGLELMNASSIFKCQKLHCTSKLKQRNLSKAIFDHDQKLHTVGSGRQFLTKDAFDITAAKFDADINPKNILIKIFLKTKDSVNILPAIIAVPLERPLVV